MTQHRQTSGKSASARVIAIAATFTAVLLSLLLAAQPASAAGPTLTASQTSGLTAAGQTITVTGSGFAPNVALFVAVCDTTKPPGSACDTSHFANPTTTASGGLSASITVYATFGTTNCTKTTCALMTNDPANPRDTTNVTTLAISFGAALPKGSDAGQADTGNQIVLGSVLVGLAVLMLGAGGLLYARRGRSQA